MSSKDSNRLARRTFRATLGLLATALLLSSLGAAALKDPFAGRWKIIANPDGKGTVLHDVLEFKGGKMTAEDLAKKGWPASPFEDDVRQGGVAKFTCEMKHPTEGTMKWTGNLAGSEIRGTITWTRPNGDEQTYTVSGSKAG